MRHVHPGAFLLSRQPWLAQMAAREAAVRRRSHPGMIARGEIAPADAEADLAAWDAIAALLAAGEADAVDWPALERAAAGALARREQACAGDPADARLAARRDAVRSIHERVAWHRAYWRLAPAAPAAAS